MKSGTENKLKFKELQSRLKLPYWQCRGLLDTLWDFAKKNAPDGNLKRFRLTAICAWMEWQQDPEELFSALIETGWLDEGEDLLYIHDWHQHAEDSVHRHLARARMYFANGEKPNLARLSRDDRAAAEEWYARDTHSGRTQDALRTHAVRPNRAVTVTVTNTEPLPSRADGVRHDSVSSGSSGEISISEEQEPSIRAATLSKLKRLREALGAGGRTRDDVLLVFQAVALTSLGEIPESFLASAVESLELDAKRSRGDPKKIKNPMAYLRASLVRQCDEHQIRFHSLIERLAIPDWANESIDRLVAQLSHGGRQAAVGAT